MKYEDWNDALVRHFFNPASAGRQVFLSVTPQVIEVLGSVQNCGIPDFVEAVKRGPTPMHFSDSRVCSKAKKVFDAWMAVPGRRTKDLPPYVGYLSLLVLAASIENTSRFEGYHKRLHELVGEDAINQPEAAFYKLMPLWDDLERWVNLDQGGCVGSVVWDFDGPWMFVGILRAQILLEETERLALPIIFERAGIDPEAPPAEDELAALVLRYGRDFLTARTLRRLRVGRRGKDEVREMLIERLLEELKDWEGAELEDGMETSITAQMRLGLELDVVGRWASFCLRCKIAGTLPGDSIEATRGGDLEPLIVEQGYMGWSKPVKLRSGAVLDAAKLNWLASWTARAPDLVLRFRAKPIRIFRAGTSEELPGEVEVNQLPCGEPFTLAVTPEYADEVFEWGRAHCEKWSGPEAVGGLPKGWQLYRARRALSTASLDGRIPGLHLPSRARIVPIGGIRSGRGSAYFDFGLPTIAVLGAEPGAVLKITDGVEVGKVGERASFDLPPASAHGRVQIELWNGGAKLASKSFSVIDANRQPVMEWERCIRSGLFGEVKSGGPICGAFGPEDVVPAFNYIKALEQQRVDLVGARPGQIASLPDEPVPEEWSPVWIVSRGRTGRRAMFCGLDMNRCQPLPPGGCSQRQVRRWKDVLWHNRKEVRPPSHPVLRKLWMDYRRAAEGV
jgi:hypothetical protein